MVIFIILSDIWSATYRIDDFLSVLKFEKTFKLYQRVFNPRITHIPVSTPLNNFASGCCSHILISRLLIESVFLVKFPSLQPLTI